MRRQKVSLRELVPVKDPETGRWDLKGIEDSAVTYSKICEMLRKREVFKFSRFGDGEWNCMFGKNGWNCDGHTYFPELGASLRRVIQSKPTYMLGMQPLSMSYERSEQIKEFCEGLDVDWYNADVLHNASIDGKLQEFQDSLAGRYLVIVGPAHLTRIFDCVHIVIPNQNCWENYEQVRQEIEFHIDGVNNAVVILCASMMSNVLIDDFADSHHTFIDAGSVFDPYCGVKSRKYHHKLKI